MSSTHTAHRLTSIGSCCCQTMWMHGIRTSRFLSLRLIVDTPRRRLFCPSATGFGVCCAPMPSTLLLLLLYNCSSRSRCLLSATSCSPNTAAADTHQGVDGASLGSKSAPRIVYYEGPDWEKQGHPFMDPASLGEKSGMMLTWLANMGQPAALAAAEDVAQERAAKEEL